jgi:hypothetical protein
MPQRATGHAHLLRVYRDELVRHGERHGQHVDVDERAEQLLVPHRDRHERHLERAKRGLDDRLKVVDDPLVLPRVEHASIRHLLCRHM